MTPAAECLPADVVQCAPLDGGCRSFHAAAAPRTLRVCHVMSADLWAGAEVQVATTASYLMTRPDVNLSAVLLNEGPLARELRRLGVQVAVVDETRTSAPGILKFLTRFLKANDIDLVHTHRYKDTVLGTMAAKLAGTPNVVRTVHGLREPMTGWNHLKFRVYETLDKATLLCFADLVIAVSKRMADTLRESGYKPTMVTHIHNGVDLRTATARRSRNDVRQELGIGRETLLIGTAGRLSPVKGHVHLLRAARLILQKEHGAKFLIVGGGPLERELVDTAARLQVDGACLFPGPRTDVHDLIAAMDIFVLPSLDEGMPMAILEAMALETPVVATAVGGVPEVVQHGVTGLLVEPGNEAALAGACLELARDRDRAQRLGAQAKRVVAEEFSHERSGGTLMDVYRSVTATSLADGRCRPRQPSRANISGAGLCWGLARKLLDYGARTVSYAVERRRMNRIRRNPAALRKALRSADSLLIMCHGNIIRSPFATHLIKHALADRSPVSVVSAGLEAVAGKPTHPTALVTATARSIDLSGHHASPVVPDRVAASDVIFVMDIPQVVAMRRRFPDARGKTCLLTCLAPELPLEIDDPVNGDEAAFQACYDHISRAVRPIVRTLSATAVHRQQAP